MLRKNSLSRMSERDVIIIPARYGSKRLPGKPLKLIAGVSMVQRVYEIALQAVQGLEHVEVVVATDDERIREHVEDFGGKVVLTPEDCPTGSDRALAACGQLGYAPRIVLNLQGDTPLMPPSFVTKMLQVMQADCDIEVGTPVIRLSWPQLDKLRESKKMTPFTGTTAVIDQAGNAIWFSKNILPAMRNEARLREEQGMSPVFQHIGLYAFRYDVLKQFVSYQESFYEQLEGLEQLRMLENGIKIKAIPVEHTEGASVRGVDSFEDIQRVEEVITSIC